jgi:hypothetical protein
LSLILGAVGYRFAGTHTNGLNHYLRVSDAALTGQPVEVEVLPEANVHYREATQWIKHNTPLDSLFLVLARTPRCEFQFRYKAVRSMWVTFKDGGFSFYKGRDEFVRWYAEYHAKVEALASLDLEAVLAYSRSRRIDSLMVEKKSFPWMVRPGLRGTELVFENPSYAIIDVLPIGSTAPANRAPTLLSPERLAAVDTGGC